MKIILKYDLCDEIRKNAELSRYLFKAKSKKIDIDKKIYGRPL